MIRNSFGFPVVDHAAVARAQAIAADALKRNFLAPCECQQCVTVRNLPAVQRILAKHVPIGERS